MGMLRPRTCYIHGDKGLDISFDKASYWANLSMEEKHWLGEFTGYLYHFAPLGRIPRKSEVII